jgi:methionyl aminopeptidase
MSNLLDDQRKAADIVTNVLLELQAHTKPDVSLDLLDEMAERLILEQGGTPYNKGYQPSWSDKPYPNTICASVDFEICHAPPRGRILREGSIVKYDLGVRYQSGCGDAALTVPVGQIDNRKRRATRYGLAALYRGIQAVQAGVSIAAVGRAMEQYAVSNGYKVIEEFGGHHIGREMHELPHIPNVYYPQNETTLLQEGAIICLEPMLTPGKGGFKIATEDGWTAFCPDGQPVVMFEHMLLVKNDGCEILTKHISL